MRASREDHPGLQELTDDLADERGELEAFSQEPIGDAGGEGRFLRQGELAARRTPVGAPDADAVVRSVWDTRPVNTRDFLILRTINEPASPGANNFQFDVPDGLTGFLRGFRFELEPITALRSRFDFLWSLTLDDAPVLDYFELPLGQFQDQFVPTFVIGASGQRLGARLRLVAPALPAGVTVFVEFYGQFMQSDGRPATLQVGNPVTGPPRYSRPLLPPDQQAAPAAVAAPSMPRARFRPRRPAPR